MNLAITIPLVVNAALGVGWIARAAPTEPPRWPLVNDWLDSVNLQFMRDEPFCAEAPSIPWAPTQVAIRAENNELNLVVYGSLDDPQRLPGSSTDEPGRAVVYVYPAPDITVGDVVAALDRLHELVPKDTIVITEMR